MILPVHLIGDPLLRKKSKPVDPAELGGPEFQEFIVSLKETMYAKDGLGLAAPQVGQLRRVVVLDASQKVEGEQLRVLINPVITARSKEQKVFTEGCLSVPNEFEDVSRPEVISLRYTDQDGKEVVLKKVQWPLSTFFQHEIDHLDGNLFVDYLSPLKRELIRKRVRKLFGVDPI